MRFALAIYVYTLDDPMIYSVINRVMFDPARGVKGAAHGNDLSPGLLACAPYIKLLDEALARLPAAFVFRGRVQRGVKWVYPRPDAHDPVRHFAPGAELTWYEFKSSSRKAEVMSQPQVGPPCRRLLCQLHTPVLIRKAALALVGNVAESYGGARGPFLP